MGTRNIKRQIAKARMKVIGIERINRRMKETNKNGVPNWKTALMDEKAHFQQTAYGRKNRRKIKKVSA
jgi:hypothetical protein